TSCTWWRAGTTRWRWGRGRCATRASPAGRSRPRRWRRWRDSWIPRFGAKVGVVAMDVAPAPKVRERRELAKLSSGHFESAVGPFVLVQRPPDPLLQKIAMHTMGARTVGMAHRSRMAEQLLEMTARFEHLQVIAPKPTLRFQELVVGRLPESDVPIF